MQRSEQTGTIAGFHLRHTLDKAQKPSRRQKTHLAHSTNLETSSRSPKTSLDAAKGTLKLCFVTSEVSALFLIRFGYKRKHMSLSFNELKVPYKSSSSSAIQSFAWDMNSIAGLHLQ